jgi:predicted nucleotidyltransferase
MSIDEKSKQKTIALISALIPDAKIYLFGSRATGRAIQGSDVDIALDTGKPLVRADVGEVRDVLNETYMPYKFDVVDMHSVSLEMQKMIIKERIIWKN